MSFLSQGEYLLAAGPLTMAEYEAIIDHSLDKRRGISHVKLGKLVKVDVKLAVNLDKDDGEVYIATRSQKLYMAFPIDGRIFVHDESTNDTSAKGTLKEGGV